MAAQGLWINLMCIAHECEPYGHLSINGKPMTAAQIGRQVGLSPKEAEALLAELLDAGVARRDEDGSVYSKRMVADERLRSIRSDAGRLGGNPNLLDGKVNHLVKQTDNQNPNLMPTPSSSSSSSSSTSVKDKEPIGSLSAARLPDCPHRRILELWGKKLPHLPQPRTWEGARKTAMRCRWAQAAKPSAYSPEGYASEDAGLRWWEAFFDYIAESKLSDGFESQGRHWQPDLEWVVNASNFQKIIDGKYDK
ncbi:MAG: hypothetical protein KGI71_04025 [Patescibacteria group bacterium]|nr:hypothetical protein [Patescibacteria group bacterium]